MSPCEAALAEIRSTTCNNVEKKLWLKAKGAVRRLGEVIIVTLLFVVIGALGAIKKGVRLPLKRCQGK